MGGDPASRMQGMTVHPATPLSLGEIVENGLCIGCGLCPSLAGPGAVEMVMTPEGRLRPLARQALDRPTLTRINAVCPGTRIAGPDQAQTGKAAVQDTIWGPAERLVLGHAVDPTVRFQASSGGVLTALGQFLLSSGRVKFSCTSPHRDRRRCAASSA